VDQDLAVVETGLTDRHGRQADDDVRREGPAVRALRPDLPRGGLADDPLRPYRLAVLVGPANLAVARALGVEARRLQAGDDDGAEWSGDLVADEGVEAGAEDVDEAVRGSVGGIGDERPVESHLGAIIGRSIRIV